MTLVDPMRPIHTEPSRRRQPGTPLVSTPSRYPAPQPIEEPTPRGTSGRRTHKQTSKQRRHFGLPKRTLAAIVLVAALMISPEFIGQILVILYGLLTILRRFSMLQTFIVAVVLVLLSPLITWLTGSEENGAIIAGYSFVLLGVGLVQLIIAYRRVDIA